MLVEFIGCPASGKTTTASKLFESLKNYDVSCEFIPEEARRFIVYKRKELKLSYNSPIKLSDEDQLKILKKQLDIELTYKTFCNPSTVIVADSSPLNTLLYMSDSMIQTQEVQSLISVWKTVLNPVIFRSMPVSLTNVLDSNRIHNQLEIDVVESKIDPILSSYGNANKIKVLFGSREERNTSCLSNVLSELIHGAL